MSDVKPNSVSLSDCFIKSESIISRIIAGEAVLVPLRRNAANLDNIYALNETAASIWDSLDGKNTLRQVLERVVIEFDVEEAEAAKDLLSLIAQLESFGAIIKV
jgi:hypothetical protein